MNTINNNGISVCPQGEEKYTTFNLQPRLRAKGKRWQYDYRHTNGELYSCIGHSLEHCREKRDVWLSSKNAHITDCIHYIPANYSTCSSCKVGGYCHSVCSNFKHK